MKRLPKRNRREFMLAAAGLLVLPVGIRPAHGEGQVIRFGVTPAFLHDRQQVLKAWQTYMSRRLGKTIQFIRRDSYRETMELIRRNQIDFAWICDYPYLRLEDKVRLLAVPRYQGRPAYRSYLIVGIGDTTTKSYKDLGGKIFAYADPYSNTGYLAPRFEIRRQGDDPASYFRKTFFTWSHRKVIEAVASGLANAGAVDSYVWESLAKVEPELTGKTRIVWRSPEFGFPPLIAHAGNVGEGEFKTMQTLLLGMAADKEGRKILQSLNLDDFTIGNRSLYESVADMMRVFGEYPAR